MLSLLSYVYTDNRCMFKCIQNFIDLSKRDAMEDMFKPLPYSMAFGNNKKASDFVIVYTYEPSKALDVSSNEYADDSFMLNDEFKFRTCLSFPAEQFNPMRRQFISHIVFKEDSG